MNPPEKPTLPPAPSPEMYGVNAPGIVGTPEQAARIAEWQRDLAKYNQEKADIYATYYGQLENYNKALETAKVKEQENIEAQKKAVQEQTREQFPEKKVTVTSIPAQVLYPKSQQQILQQQFVQTASYKSPQGQGFYPEYAQILSKTYPQYTKVVKVGPEGYKETMTTIPQLIHEVKNVEHYQVPRTYFRYPGGEEIQIIKPGVVFRADQTTQPSSFGQPVNMKEQFLESAKKGTPAYSYAAIPFSIGLIGGQRTAKDIIFSGLPFTEKVSQLYEYEKSEFTRPMREYEKMKTGTEIIQLQSGKIEAFGGKPYSELKPYEKRGTMVITKITPYTIGEIASSGLWRGAKVVIPERIVKEAAVQEEILPKFQSEVTPTTTPKELEDINKRFQEAVIARYSELEKEYQPIYKKIQKQETFGRIIESSPLIAAGIGLSLFMPSFGVSTLLIGAYGAVQTIRYPSSFFTSIKLEQSPEGKVYGYTLNEQYTGWGTAKLGIAGGTMLLGAYGMAYSAAQEVTAAQVWGVINLKPEAVRTIRIDVGAGRFMDYSIITKTTGEAQMITKTFGIGQLGEKGAYTVAGTQESIIKTYDFWKGIESKLLLGSEQTFLGTGQLGEEGILSLSKGGISQIQKGWTPSLTQVKTIIQEGWSPSLTQVKTMKSSDFSYLGFRGKEVFKMNIYGESPIVTSNIAGISLRTDNIIKSISGKPTSIMKTETGYQLGFSGEQFGITKIIKPQEEYGASTFISGRKGTTTKFAAPDISTSIAQITSKEIPSVTSIIPSTSLKTIIGVTGIVGITTQQIKTARHVPIFNPREFSFEEITTIPKSRVMSFSPQQMFQPRQEEKIRQPSSLVSSLIGISSLEEMETKQIPVTVPVQVTYQTQAQKQGLKLGSIFGQPSTPPSPTTIPPSIPFGGPFGGIGFPFRFPSFDTESSGYGQKAKKRKYRYTPTLSGLFSGRMIKPSKGLNFRSFSGFEKRYPTTRRTVSILGF